MPEIVLQRIPGYKFVFTVSRPQGTWVEDNAVLTEDELAQLGIVLEA